MARFCVILRAEKSTKFITHFINQKIFTMKRNLLIVAILAVTMGLCSKVNAQAYTHSIGGNVGNMQAVSYKTFITNHFAIQVDLGTKITLGAGRHWNAEIWDLELNPNFMYEGHFTKGLYGFIGGGVSLGYNWNIWGAHYNWVGHHWGSRTCDNGKFGANAIMGLEYKFNAPVTLQFDFRPGYGLLFNRDWNWSYFDWGLNLSCRYTF